MFDWVVGGEAGRMQKPEASKLGLAGGARRAYCS